MKHFSKHLPHYLTLIGILLIGLFGFVIFSHDRVFQVAIAIAIALSYVVWGIIHHFLHKDLYLIVLVEYMAVALLGLIIVLSLIART